MPGRAITQHCPQCQMPLVLPEAFLGRTVACSRCGQDVIVQGDAASASPLPPHLGDNTAVPLEPHAPPMVQPPSPVPPHLQAGRWTGAPEPIASVIPLEPVEDEIAGVPAGRSCLATGLLLLMLVAMVSTAVVGVVLLVGWTSRRGENGHTANEEEGGPPAQKIAINKREYTNASRKSVARAGVLVRIDDVAVGKVNYRSKGEILETATPNYLMITLNVKNKSRDEPVLYKSWYSYKFEDEEKGSQRVELIDEDGKQIDLFLIPGADTVERHIRSDISLPLNDDIYDTLIFKLPDDYLDNPVPPLYLKLPAAAIGDEGNYQFHIPGTMTERRD